MNTASEASCGVVFRWDIQPSGAVGTVIGGHANEGPWYQLMLWRRGVPTLFREALVHAVPRALGLLAHVALYRGQFMVVVRTDPHSVTLSARPTDASRVWSFGPFDRDEATRVRDELGRAIDSGRWVPVG